MLRGQLSPRGKTGLRYCVISHSRSRSACMSSSAIAPFVSVLNACGWQELPESACSTHGFFRKQDVDLVLSLDGNGIYERLGGDVAFNHFKNHQAVTNKAHLSHAIAEYCREVRMDSASFFPATFVLHNEDERSRFLQSFRSFAAWAILTKLSNSQRHLYDHGRHQETVVFALSHCRHMLALLKQPSATVASVNRTLLREFEHRAGEMRKQYTTAWNALHQLSLDSRWQSIPVTLHLYEQAATLLNALRDLDHPLFRTISTENLWMLKPSDRSRGVGISVHRNVDKLLAESKRSTGVRIAQKCVETPMIDIIGRKFDIRVWALVTSWDPLQLWIYNTFYGRCSPAIYAKTSKDKRVHLCNYSLHKPSPRRRRSSSSTGTSPRSAHSTLLSKEDVFRMIYRQGGDPVAAWGRVQQTCVHAFRSAAKHVSNRAKSFELYGIDFVLDRAHHPWLIEVSLSPGLATHGSKQHSSTVKTMIHSLIDLVFNHTKPPSGWKKVFHGVKASPPSSGIRFLLMGRKISKTANRRHDRILNRVDALHRLKRFVNNLPFRWRCIQRKRHRCACVLQRHTKILIIKARKRSADRLRVIHRWAGSYAYVQACTRWIDVASRKRSQELLHALTKCVTAATFTQRMTRMFLAIRHYASIKSSLIRIQRWTRHRQIKDRLRRSLARQAERKRCRERILHRRICRTRAAKALQCWWTKLVLKGNAAKRIQTAWRQYSSRAQQLRQEQQVLLSKVDIIRSSNINTAAARTITRFLRSLDHDKSGPLTHELDERVEQETVQVQRQVPHLSSLNEEDDLLHRVLKVTPQPRRKSTRKKSHPAFRKRVQEPVPRLWQRGSRPRLPPVLL